MNRPTPIRISALLRSIHRVALLPAAVASPAFAHVTSSAEPHAHGSDVSGLIAVVALVAIAAWIDRRQR